MARSIWVFIGICLSVFAISSCGPALHSALAIPSDADSVSPHPGFSMQVPLKSESVKPLPTGAFYMLVDATNASPRRYSTVGHKILDIYSATGTVTPQMYEKLDGLVDRASARLKNMSLNVDQEKDAERLLKEIDAVLTEENFVYPSWDYVGTLVEGLTPVELDADGLKAVKESYYNRNREEHLVRRGQSRRRFHVIPGASLPVGNVVATNYSSTLHLALPAVVIVAALLYLGSNNAIIRCGAYIRRHIEPSSVKGWECWLEEEEKRRTSDRTISVARIGST